MSQRSARDGIVVVLVVVVVVVVLPKDNVDVILMDETEQRR